MYYLYYADEYHNILGYLTSFETFSKARIVKYFHRHEKLVCLYITNSQQKEILKRYLGILKDHSKNKTNYDSRFFEGRDLVELVLSKLEHFGIPLKLFKHEVEVKPFIKSAPKITKSTQKNVKITKTKEAKVAKKSTKKKKLAGNALKQKAYALIKRGAAKLVANKGRGKSKNTRYGYRESKGVYVYILKDRK